MQKTLGGDRLGAGKKMKVELHGYERSTHDLGYLWRSTMSSGTLVPFMSKLVLPGDTFDINLDCDIKTHPTIGPLFGSFKVQLDVFQAPIRLYNSALHNNTLNIGRNMSTIKLPQIELTARGHTVTADDDIDNLQINPSCLLAYLGIRGVGLTDEDFPRQFNAIPILAYWEIYKQYYANKQEEIGAVIHTPATPLISAIVTWLIQHEVNPDVAFTQEPALNNVTLDNRTTIEIAWGGGTAPEPSQILINTTTGTYSLASLFTNIQITPGFIRATFNQALWGNLIAINWNYISAVNPNFGKPDVATFPLTHIDDMRSALLSQAGTSVAEITSLGVTSPYTWLNEIVNGMSNMLSSQEGLAIKTYQSDLFNNWLSTEWIDGVGGISEITSIDTSGGSFSIDTLILSKKVYNMLNRIAVSGGSYDDWMDAVYAHDRYQRCESPMYMGGLIKELVFQEVVSNSESTGGESGSQPLGTLAGKGVMAKKHKGGHIIVKVDEPSYIIGLISLTPRIDYSQGNNWDIHLKTMDDLHKPALDEIGFQELITEQMAWWDTTNNVGVWTQKSAGKQPAWINYMTAVNKCYGNFAVQQNEMFMTLNRRYEITDITETIKDLTTYIDPVKYNFIFANTALDAQNFWAQIAVDITARRKMSAKLMPNL